MANKDSSTIVNHKPHVTTHQFISSTTLDKMLYEKSPEQDQEIQIIQQAKDLLGNEYEKAEIKEIIASFEYLTNNWLEEYEKKVFSNKTLKEILKSV